MSQPHGGSSSVVNTVVCAGSASAGTSIWKGLSLHPSCPQVLNPPKNKMKRKSDWGNFSHHLVGIGRPGRNGQDDRVRVVSYKPVSPRKRLVPPPLFEGRVKWGD